MQEVYTVDGRPAEAFPLTGQRLEIVARTGDVVTVDYEHGYDTVPDLVRLTVAGSSRSCSKRTPEREPVSASAAKTRARSVCRRPTLHGLRVQHRGLRRTT